MGKIEIKNQKEFTLNQVKFENNGGISAEFQFEAQGDNGKTLIDSSIKCEDLPHPHLTKLIDHFKKPIIMCANGFVGSNAVLKNKLILEKGIKDSAIDSFKKDIEDILSDHVRIHGVHLYHRDSGTTIKVTGGFDSELGYAAINTPEIRFDEVRFGFEDEIREAVEKLISEVFKYIVKGKRAQLDAFSEEDKAA